MRDLSLGIFCILPTHNHYAATPNSVWEQLLSLSHVLVGGRGDHDRVRDLDCDGIG